MIIEKTYTTQVSGVQLFQAWISEEAVIAPVERIESDPVEGGRYRLWSGPSVMTGVFKRVIPNELLQYSWCWDEAEEMTEITVKFSDHPEGGTQVSLTHSAFLSEESRAMHDTGWDSYFEGLIRFIKTGH